MSQFCHSMSNLSISAGMDPPPQLTEQAHQSTLSACILSVYWCATKKNSSTWKLFNWALVLTWGFNLSSFMWSTLNVRRCGVLRMIVPFTNWGTSYRPTQNSEMPSTSLVKSSEMSGIGVSSSQTQSGRTLSASPGSFIILLWAWKR